MALRAVSRATSYSAGETTVARYDLKQLLDKLDEAIGGQPG